MAANSNVYPSCTPAGALPETKNGLDERIGLQLLLSSAALSNRPQDENPTVVRLPKRRSDTPPLLDPAS